VRPHRCKPVNISDIDALSIGCALGFLESRAGFKIEGRYSAVLLYASVAALVGTLMLETPSRISASAITILQGVFVATAIHSSVAARDTFAFFVLNNWTLVWIGGASYSLYVWHFLFLAHFMGTHTTNFYF
jgi:peptidoglycan/LPS O-acetylase OafA/YrhL